MDDGNGTIAADSTGNDLYGILDNGPNWTPTGQIGGALNFGGTDDYVYVADNSVFSPANNNITVAAWIKPATFDFTGTDLSCGCAIHFLTKGQPSQHEWAFRLYNAASESPKRMTFHLFSLDGSSSVGSYFQDDLAANEWIHVVGVINDSETKIYKNGTLRDTDAYSGEGKKGKPVVPGDGLAPVRIGARTGTSFNGAIDDVRVYTRALIDAEITALYEGSSPPPAPPTLVSIAVTPVGPSIIVGSTQQFTAMGTYSDTTNADITNDVTWASSTTTVSTMAVGGLATAVAEGTTTISATTGTVGGSSTLSVTPAPPPPPPVAAFTGTPTNGDAPLTVAFTDASSDTTGWSWDFGDTGTSSLQHPSHTYSTAGTYTVTLTVTGTGGTDILTKTDYITVAAPPPPSDGTWSSGDLEPDVWSESGKPGGRDGHKDFNFQPPSSITAIDRVTVTVNVSGYNALGSASIDGIPPSLEVWTKRKGQLLNQIGVSITPSGPGTLTFESTAPSGIVLGEGNQVRIIIKSLNRDKASGAIDQMGIDYVEVKILHQP